MNEYQSITRSVITPNDKFLRSVFSVPQSYYIDIYQRDYKWTVENVQTLLNDIEVRFGQHSRLKKEPKEIQADVKESFEPYFLNTYLTHSTPTSISIVDGQQRLTTLLLMLIKLYKILQKIEQSREYTEKTVSSDTLEKLIFEADDFGEASRFKIFNLNRETAFRSLVDGNEFRPADETQQRLKGNYKLISDYYESFFMLPNEARYEINKLTYYITYLLDRISIVEIKIEKQKNVAMIFEVVNDRGLGLKPYEILKGKLIGNLPSEKKEKANAVWTELQDHYFRAEVLNSTESKLDLDMFFKTFFRAKFARNEAEYEKFEGDYHYEMYRNKEIRNYFSEFVDQELLYRRIMEDIKYFAETYLWLRTTYDNEYLIYNKLLDQNQQYMLILSALSLNDENRDDKITGIARKFDQFHTVIRLLDTYESNSFQRLIYPLNDQIREKTLTEAFTVFDMLLIRYLEEEDVIRKSEIDKTTNLFTYERFAGMHNRWTNFSKYILMRIDRYLAELLDKPSYASDSLKMLEEHFNKTTRRKCGMHLEHIYAYNLANMKLFTNDKGIFDEQQFNVVRNKLGMVLLLKDRQNESSNNESYEKKFTTYKKSNFIWNEMMVGHLHGVDEKKLPAELCVETIMPDETGAFPRAKVEIRQKHIFQTIRKIWAGF
jgi:uncharacterized protein with ParB-like and HNH nuclease domain